MQSNASNIWQVLLYSKEKVKIGPKNWFFGVFFIGFSITPSYALQVTLQSSPKLKVLSWYTIFSYFLNHLNLPTRLANICPLNINFTHEKENVDSLSFLDVKICRKNSKFVTSVYGKPIFSGVFTDYENFIPTYWKRGFLHTLLHRSFSISCDFKTFHFEIDHLKTILIKNNYPLNFIDPCIKPFLNKLYTPKVMVPNVPKRNVFVKLPFLGSTSFQIRKKLQKLFSDKLTPCNLKIVFTSPVSVKTFFIFKDKLSKMLLSCYYKCVAARLPIMERPNAILRSEFVNI